MIFPLRVLAVLLMDTLRLLPLRMKWRMCLLSQILSFMQGLE